MIDRIYPNCLGQVFGPTWPFGVAASHAGESFQLVCFLFFFPGKNKSTNLTSSPSKAQAKLLMRCAYATGTPTGLAKEAVPNHIPSDSNHLVSQIAFSMNQSAPFRAKSRLII